MSDNNTIAGWILAGGIAALGFSIVSGKYFHADKHERPETMGFIIEGVEASGGAKEEMPMSMMLAKADVAAGEKIFKKCVSCHVITPGSNEGKQGPSLYGMLGKDVASISGFAYSGALEAVEGNWNFDNMNAWLISPRKFANGTKMTFAGLGKSEDRANIIAYMNAQGSNLPVPAAPVAEETPAEETAEAEAAAETDAAASEVAEETPAADAAATEE